MTEPKNLKKMEGSWNSISFIHINLSFLFLFISNCQDVFAVSTKHLCHPEQRDAILEFKNEFKVMKPCLDGGPKMESWMNNSDCCSWDGIRCDAKSGYVINLNLSSNCLNGQLTSKSTLFILHYFRFLTILDLSNNNLTGQIPYSLGNFTNLETLDFSSNRFSGKIPSSLGNLTHLITLGLSQNDFSGEIPSSLGNLFHLTSLHLCANNFFGKIPSSLENLSHLTVLSLCENNFSGEIFSLLGNLSHLTFLDISQNNFIGEIPSSFGNLNQLTGLAFENNKFSGNFPFTLLFNMTNLIELSLYGNQFTGTLPLNMNSLSNLEFFYIQNNAFTGTLSSSLFSIPSLTYIDLGNNQFNGTLEFGNISSKIEDLRLGNNNLRGSIPLSIFKLVNLERLDLSHLNTTTVIDLNTILSYSKSLVTLDLSGIQVSVTNKTSVSSPLSQLYLSGCGITEFPELLRTQLRLTYLDLSNNKIKGEVPGWLWTLPILQYVNLSNNTFVGFERPTNHGLSSFQEPSMSYMSGANNNFRGNIPSFICELRSLNTLDLSNNKFNGSIPLCMGNFSSALQVLILRQNRLSGGLPENISEGIVSLDVGHNQLMGMLSRSLVHNSVLEVLNVESNKINDKFPFWLSSLPKLQVLVLRSNSFHGPIQLTQFSKLRIIDISHNDFNGTLPSNCFTNWIGMSSLGENDDHSNEKYMGTGYYFDSMVLMNKGVAMELVRILKIYTAIDFSGNRFEGEIPRSIGLLKELHVLNLSNNAFTGHIPSSMANLIQLESLDVSQNKLSGEIPQELGKLTYLAYMNFSHNQLVGLVPGGTQFETQPCSSFDENPGLYGPSLEKSCVNIHGKTSQNSETPELEEDEEEVISWIAAVVGFIPGTFVGFTMGYILVSYKREWFMNLSYRRPAKTQQHNSIKSFLNPKIFEYKSKEPNRMDN